MAISPGERACRKDNEASRLNLASSKIGPMLSTVDNGCGTSRFHCHSKTKSGEMLGLFLGAVCVGAGGASGFAWFRQDKGLARRWLFNAVRCNGVSFRC